MIGSETTQAALLEAERTREVTLFPNLLAQGSAEAIGTFLVNDALVPAAVASGALTFSSEDAPNTLVYPKILEELDGLDVSQRHGIVDVDRGLPAIRVLRVGLEEIYQRRIRAGGYISSAGRSVLHWHRDADDVLAIMARRRKKIALRSHKGAKMTEVTMTPGDGLFIPAGVPHCATGLDDGSAQLCFVLLEHRA